MELSTRKLRNTRESNPVYGKNLVKTRHAANTSVLRVPPRLQRRRGSVDSYRQPGLMDARS